MLVGQVTAIQDIADNSATQISTKDGSEEGRICDSGDHCACKETTVVSCVVGLSGGRTFVAIARESLAAMFTLVHRLNDAVNRISKNTLYTLGDGVNKCKVLCAYNGMNKNFSQYNN